MSKLKFIKYYSVSHETLEKLSIYIELLLKWNSKINLISRSSAEDVWIRHLLDSAQLMKFIDKSQKILDVGSGAGFPGIVLSILGIEEITLLDSDQRKCSFLLEVARLLNLKLEVINGRIEDICDQSFDIVTARGFASVGRLLKQIDAIKTGRILLLKGKNYDLEIQEALQEWDFRYITYPSITDFGSYIVDITNVHKS
jgi:16S rRNA (guanine527-N7)-methyltransferase